MRLLNNLSGMKTEEIEALVNLERTTENQITS